ncbi:hypothetical protein BpHYR1_051485 [Brachionus plicatilis]|uniref:Uncharacterized protein n=1 Tax=Brachionus plicatilis TaxID=10195 RepID=A0A3M7QIS0_BRAPC|nr:hypothetical protein BpHYR1_051485 [Brachionus plicatilis]
MFNASISPKGTKMPSIWLENSRTKFNSNDPVLAKRMNISRSIVTRKLSHEHDAYENLVKKARNLHPNSVLSSNG